MKKQFIFFPPNIPVLAVMCQTNKSGGKKNIEALGVTARRQLRSGESQTFWLSLGDGAGVITYPSSTPLSGADAAALFGEQAPSVTYRMRFVPVRIHVPRRNAAAPAGNGNLLEVFNQNESLRVTARRNFCFLRHPITLVPLAILRTAGSPRRRG